MANLVSFPASSPETWEWGYILDIDDTLAGFRLASSPGSLLKNGGRREPGDEARFRSQGYNITHHLIINFQRDIILICTKLKEWKKLWYIKTDEKIERTQNIEHGCLRKASPVVSKVRRIDS